MREKHCYKSDRAKINLAGHWVRAHWTDKICLAFPKFSLKFVSAKFSICWTWAHWDTAKYLLTTSVNHTLNKHHHFARCSWERLHEISGVVGLLCVTVIFTASIECVASAYYLACEKSRLSFLRYCVSHFSMRGGCIRRLHNYCLCSIFFFLPWIRSTPAEAECQWRLHLFGLQRFGTRNNNFSGPRTEILRLKIEIAFSSLTFSFKSCRFQGWKKFVLLWGRTTASLKFGKHWKNLLDLKITGRTCLRQLVTIFFAK